MELLEGIVGGVEHSHERGAVRRERDSAIRHSRGALEMPVRALPQGGGNGFKRVELGVEDAHRALRERRENHSAVVRQRPSVKLLAVHTRLDGDLKRFRLGIVRRDSRGAPRREHDSAVPSLHRPPELGVAVDRSAHVDRLVRERLGERADERGTQERARRGEHDRTRRFTRSTFIVHASPRSSLVSSSAPSWRTQTCSRSGTREIWSR